MCAADGKLSRAEGWGQAESRRWRWGGREEGFEVNSRTIATIVRQTKQKTDEQKLKEYIYRLKGFGPLSLSPEAKSFLKKKVQLNTKLLSQQQMIELFEGDSSNIYINQLRANKKKQEARKKKEQQQKTLEQEQAKKRLIETQKQKLKLEREKKAQLVKGKQLSEQLENIGKLGVVSNRLQQERKKEQARLQAQAKKLQAKQKKEKEQAKKLQAQAQAKQAKAKQLQAKMKEQSIFMKKINCFSWMRKRDHLIYYL